jgi:hypothetical protein
MIRRSQIRTNVIERHAKIIRFFRVSREGRTAHNSLLAHWRASRARPHPRTKSSHCQDDAMSAFVKVFGRRPHDGGAAHTGAGVRKTFTEAEVQSRRSPKLTNFSASHSASLQSQAKRVRSVSPHRDFPLASQYRGNTLIHRRIAAARRMPCNPHLTCRSCRRDLSIRPADVQIK